MSISVIIVDDHELIHNGIQSMLTETNAEIIGHAHDGDSAVELCTKLQPNLVLLDVLMPGKSGIDTLESC